MSHILSLLSQPCQITVAELLEWAITPVVALPEWGITPAAELQVWEITSAVELQAWATILVEERLECEVQVESPVVDMVFYY